MARMALLLAAAAGLGACAVAAQKMPTRPGELPLVFSGNDLGFRVEPIQDGRPVGTLVVRIDDEWVDVGFLGATSFVDTD